jgi:hypothetical protein
MLWSIFVILAILWLLGFINSYYLVGSNSVLFLYYILKNNNLFPWPKYHQGGHHSQAE